MVMTHTLNCTSELNWNWLLCTCKPFSTNSPQTCAVQLDHPVSLTNKCVFSNFLETGKVKDSILYTKQTAQGISPTVNTPKGGLMQPVCPWIFALPVRIFWKYFSWVHHVFGVKESNGDTCKKFWIIYCMILDKSRSQRTFLQWPFLSTRL